MTIAERNVRLLAIDLDGTLLDNDRQLVPKNAEAVRRAASSGITIVLASGRTQPSMQPFVESLGVGGPLICANGAHVLAGDGSELAHHPLAARPREILIRYALEHGFHLNAYTRDELLFLKQSKWGDLYQHRLRSMTPRIATAEEMMEASLSKLMLVGVPSQIPGVRSYLEPLVDPSEARLTESEPEYIEFLSPKADKSIGLATVASHLGIRAEESSAIGDYLNDLDMLKWVGVSGAVGNAREEVKSAVHFVVNTNESGGVAEFIDSVLLRGRE